MARHELKTWPEHFEAILNGDKRFEVRKNDKGFEKGDALILNEFNPETQQYTGRMIFAAVSYVMPGGAFGISKDYCVMSIVTTHPRNIDVAAAHVIDRFKKAYKMAQDGDTEIAPDWDELEQDWIDYFAVLFSK